MFFRKEAASNKKKKDKYPGTGNQKKKTKKSLVLDVSLVPEEEGVRAVRACLT